MLKKIIFFISLIIFSNSTILLHADIIPLKKPLQSKEEKDQKLLIDILKPLPKPTTKKIIEKKPENKISSKKENFQGIILPKKKPLIAMIESNIEGGSQYWDYIKGELQGEGRGAGMSYRLKS